MRSMKVALCGVALLIAATAASADVVIPEIGSTSFSNSEGVVTMEPAGWWADMGEYFGFGRAYVVPIQLPTLPAGAEFGSVDLAFGHHGPGMNIDGLRTGFFGGGDPNYNIDLYGLSRVSSAADVIEADHFSGPSDAAAALLQDAFLDPTSPGNRTIIHTTASGDAALADWLNTMYADGANAGQYVFVRLNPDGVDGSLPWSGYQVMTSGAGGADEKPALTYSVVPEPATLVLLGLGAVALIRRR